MRQLEKNLQPGSMQPVVQATPTDAFPTLLEFLASNGSKWCRISIKPTKVSMSFKANNKTYHYGVGQNLLEAYAMLQQRVLQYFVRPESHRSPVARRGESEFRACRQRLVWRSISDQGTHAPSSRGRRPVSQSLQWRLKSRRSSRRPHKTALKRRLTLL